MYKTNSVSNQDNQDKTEFEKAYLADNSSFHGTESDPESIYDEETTDVKGEDLETGNE